MYIEFYCNAMCSSRNYPYLPTEGILYRTLHSSLWKFQLSFRHFFNCFGLIEVPHQQKIPIPSVGRAWIFPGTAQWQQKVNWKEGSFVLV